MKNSNQIMVISGGACNGELVRRLIIEKAIDTVIVVDGGLKVVDELQIMPNYIVGDFDSIDERLLSKYKKFAENDSMDAPIIKTYSPKKDDTDTEIAIRLCIELKPQEVTIVGATGTRLDHTFANMHLLMKLLEERIPAAIYDGHNKIYLIDQPIRLYKKNLYGPYFSMLPFSETVSGITLKGFKYPLDNRKISLGTSLCISNEVVEETAQLMLKDGILLIFESLD